MFERYTDRARRVVVLSQEEARMLGHNYIGTEHILLGLLHEGTGVAARALTALGFSLAEARTQVEEIIGRDDPAHAPEGHMPFTPRAKKVLELASRESQDLGHTYVGTEHILLGLMREGDGVGAQVINLAGAEFASVRHHIRQLLHSRPEDVVPTDAPPADEPAAEVRAADAPPAQLWQTELWRADGRRAEMRRIELRLSPSGRAGIDIGSRLASLDARLAVIERRLREVVPGEESS